MIKETDKIFGNGLAAGKSKLFDVDVTCVRVPVLRSHCEAIHLTFERPLKADKARDILSQFPGIKIVDNREQNQFPEPLHSANKDEVYVGRIRQDYTQGDKGLAMFVAFDQILKGAALNAVQIAELILNKK